MLPVKRDGRNSPYTVYTGHWCSRGISVLDTCLQWLKFVNSLYTTEDSCLTYT